VDVKVEMTVEGWATGRGRFEYHPRKRESETGRPSPACGAFHEQVGDRKASFYTLK